MSVRIIRTSLFPRTAPTESQELKTISSKNSIGSVPLILGPCPKQGPRLGRGKRARGFTLIEILIVLAIVSIVMAMGLPAIQQVTNQRINSTARKFVGLIRTVRNDAILLNNIYRIVFDMEKKLYWVEEQREFKLLNQGEEPPPSKKKLSKANEEPPSNFIYAQKFSKKPIEMPPGVVVSGILKEKEGLRKEGVAYIYFFPNGFNEQAILYMNKEGATTNAFYSLVVHPTSGKVDIQREYVDRFE